jgi:hypothetical protein
MSSIVDALSNQKPPEKVEMAHRKRVAEACFEVGIELSKVRGKLKELLEEARPSRLTIGDASNLPCQVVAAYCRSERGRFACCRSRWRAWLLHF